MKVLDLFSGLRGWTAPLGPGDRTFSIDWDRRFLADAYLDIGDVSAVLDAMPWRPDIVFASPPCQSFSTMTMGRMWTPSGEPKHPLAVEGRRLVLATVRIIAALRPEWWVIENPRARLRTLGLLDGLPRVTVTYCQYGERRMKPTDLWGVFPRSWQPRPMCRNGAPCHVRAPRGSTTGTQGTDSAVAGRIPYQLAESFYLAIRGDAGQAPETLPEAA